MPVGVEPIHAGDRAATLEAIAKQAAELDGQATATVTCPCGTSGQLETGFRCFYCEVFFCPSCAADHFDVDDGAACDERGGW